MSQISRPAAFDADHPSRRAGAVGGGGVVSRDAKMSSDLGFDDDDDDDVAGSGASDADSTEDDAGRGAASAARFPSSGAAGGAASRSNVGRALAGTSTSFGDASRLAASGGGSVSADAASVDAVALVRESQDEIARLQHMLTTTQTAASASDSYTALMRRSLMVGRARRSAAKRKGDAPKGRRC